MKQLIFPILAAAVILTACTSNNNQQPQSERHGGTLRVNVSDIPHVVFPGRINKRSEQMIVNQVYDGLVKYNPQTLQIVPSIAKKYTISDDKLTYTFTLDSRARFQDSRCFKFGRGRNIVAADVKYSVEQVFRIQLLNDYKNFRQILNIEGADQFLKTAKTNDSVNISGIIAQNDTTLIFKLKKADDLFIHYLAGPNTLVFAKEAFNTFGINGTAGSGAFIIKYPTIKGQPIELVRNRKYWKTSAENEPLPYLDTLVFSFVTSTQKELYMFEKEMVDVVLDIPTKFLTPFLDANIDRFKGSEPRSVMTQTINLNNDKRFNLLSSSVNNLYINSQGYFDFSEVYLKKPEPHAVANE